VNWYLEVLKKYAVFEGRAPRREYWWYTLFSTIVVVVLFALGRVSVVFTVLAAVYALATFVPTIAVACRRLHDTNKSGWLQLIGIIPFGGLVLIVLYCLGSDPGSNRHGPNPDAVPEPAGIG
jgi:uncharacterized membrane protein YhaH (DUF805 family)